MSDGASERRRDDTRQLLSDDRERHGATAEELGGRATAREVARRRWIVGVAVAGLAMGIVAMVVLRARARPRRRLVRAARALAGAGPSLASAGRGVASRARGSPAGAAAIAGAAAGALTAAALVRARTHPASRRASVGEMNLLSSLSATP